jgi:nitrate/nitrite-specific signal transduction histidine kinase
MASIDASAQLEALLRLQQELALETDIDKVLTRIVETARETLSAERATLYVIDHAKDELWSRVLTRGNEPGVTELTEIRLPLDGQSLAAEVARTGTVLRIDAPYDDPRFDPSTDQRTGFRTRSILVAPIDSRDRRRLGVLQVVNKIDGVFTAKDEEFIQGLAGSAGISLEYVQLSEELAAERLRVVHVAEEERRRLARDLHDGVAQTIANTAIGIELAGKRARQDVAAAFADLDVLRTRLVDAQKGLRDILFALRPLPLEDGGLPAAIKALAERLDGTNGSHVKARRVDSQRRLRPEVEAGAVVAIVEDDGKGFDVSAVLSTYATRGSLGLLQMRESARLIGSQLSIDSSPGQGTRIRLRIPGGGGPPSASGASA